MRHELIMVAVQPDIKEELEEVVLVALVVMEQLPQVVLEVILLLQEQD